MHRILCFCLAAAFVTGCGPRASLQFAPAPALDGLPAPSALADLPADPARGTSGSHATLNRTFLADGNSFVALPGWSANAVPADANARITGMTDSLSYAFYQVAPTVLDHTQTFAEIEVDYAWTGGAPAAPRGFYIGLPDYARDRWVWIEGAEANGQWLDVSARNLRGLDPAIAPAGSYIAVVNFSDSVVDVNRVALRYDEAGAVNGDEWVYYTARLAGHQSVARVPVSGGPSELIHTGDGTINYGFPFVVHYHGAWQLVYTRFATGEKTQVWMSGLDGAAPWSVASSSSEHMFSAGWDYNSDRGLFLRTATGNAELLAFHDTFEFGRLSNVGHNVAKAVWNVNNDLVASGYNAIASVEIDDINDYNHIALFVGNPPFDIDADPIPLYARLADENAHDPEMVELGGLDGSSRSWIYCASENRDHPSFNLYRLPATGTLGGPAPVLINAAFNYRFPALSRDGRHLAFMRQPAGSDPTVPFEIVMVDLLHPTGTEQVLATDCVAQLSWYDPTP